MITSAETADLVTFIEEILNGNLHFYTVVFALTFFPGLTKMHLKARKTLLYLF